MTGETDLAKVEKKERSVNRIFDAAHRAIRANDRLDSVDRIRYYLIQRNIKKEVLTLSNSFG